eukprot:g690.t1
MKTSTMKTKKKKKRKAKKEKNEKGSSTGIFGGNVSQNSNVSPFMNTISSDAGSGIFGTGGADASGGFDFESGNDEKSMFPSFKSETGPFGGNINHDVNMSAETTLSVRGKNRENASGGQRKSTKKSRPPCRYFLNGNCTRGDSCHFSHDPIHLANAGKNSNSTTSDTQATVKRATERRRDKDGNMYTRAQFLTFYGGVAEWNAAPRVSATTSKAPIVEQAVNDRRQKLLELREKRAKAILENARMSEAFAKPSPFRASKEDQTDVLGRAATQQREQLLERRKIRVQALKEKTRALEAAVAPPRKKTPSINVGASKTTFAEPKPSLPAVVRARPRPRARAIPSTDAHGASAYVTCEVESRGMVPDGCSAEYTPPTGFTRGTCDALCPREEALKRAAATKEGSNQHIKIQMNPNNPYVHVFELPPGGQCVTRYHRAAADLAQTVDPSTLRTIPYLARSADQIFRFALVQDLEETPLNPNFQDLPDFQARQFPEGRPKFKHVHSFMLNRLRKIVKELKQQGYGSGDGSPVSALAVVILERITRYLIFAEYAILVEVQEEPVALRTRTLANTYNLTREQLNRTIMLLREVYMQIRKRLRWAPPNAPEIEAYYMYLQLARLAQQNFDRHSEKEIINFTGVLRGFDAAVLTSKPIQRAVSIAAKIRCGDYVGVLRTWREAPFLDSVLIYQLVPRARKIALEGMVRTCYPNGGTKRSLASITRLLGFDNPSAAAADLRLRGVDVSSDESTVHFVRRMGISGDENTGDVPMVMVGSKEPATRWQMLTPFIRSGGASDVPVIRVVVPSPTSRTKIADDAAAEARRRAQEKADREAKARAERLRRETEAKERKARAAKAKAAAELAERRAKEAEAERRREVRVRQGLERKLSSAEKTLGDLCLAIGKAATTPQSTAGSVNSGDGCSNGARGDAAKAIDAKIAEARARLDGMRDEMARSVRRDVASARKTDEIATKQELLKKIGDHLERSKSEFRQAIERIRALTQSKIESIKSESERRAAATNARLQDIRTHAAFHGILSAPRVSVAVRDAERACASLNELGDQFVSSVGRGDRAGLSEGRAKILEAEKTALTAVSSAEVAVRSFCGKQRVAFKDRISEIHERVSRTHGVATTNSRLVAIVDDASKSASTEERLAARAVIETDAEAMKLLKRAYEVFNESEASIPSLRAAVEEAEGATRTAEVSVQAWCRARNQVIMRRWIRLWRYRARVATRVLVARMDEERELQQFRRSAFGRGNVESLDIVEDVLASMSIVGDAKRTDAALDDLEKDAWAPMNVEAVVAAPLAAAQRSRTEETDLHWQCAVLATTDAKHFGLRRWIARKLSPSIASDGSGTGSNVLAIADEPETSGSSRVVSVALRNRRVSLEGLLGVDDRSVFRHLCVCIDMLDMADACARPSACGLSREHACIAPLVIDTTSAAATSRDPHILKWIDAIETIVRRLDVGTELVLGACVAFRCSGPASEEVATSCQSIMKIVHGKLCAIRKRVGGNRVGAVQIHWIQRFDPNSAQLRLSSVAFERAIRAVAGKSRPQPSLCSAPLHAVVNACVDVFLAACDETECGRPRAFADWVGIYNAVIEKLARFLSDRDRLARIVWPPTRIVAANEEKLPPVSWNDESRLARVRNLLRAAALPALPMSNEASDDLSDPASHFLMSADQYARRVAIGNDGGDDNNDTHALSLVTDVARSIRSFCSLTDADLSTLARSSEGLRARLERRKVVLWRSIFGSLVAHRILQLERTAREAGCEDVYWSARDVGKRSSSSVRSIEALAFTVVGDVLSDRRRRGREASDAPTQWDFLVVLQLRKLCTRHRERARSATKSGDDHDAKREEELKVSQRATPHKRPRPPCSEADVVAAESAPVRPRYDETVESVESKLKRAFEVERSGMKTFEDALLRCLSETSSVGGRGPGAPPMYSNEHVDVYGSASSVVAVNREENDAYEDNLRRYLVEGYL